MHPIARAALAVAASAGLSVFAASVAEAKVRITVDLDRQMIHVEGRGQVYDWKVSSGRAGFETPAGRFGVLWMDKDHHSDEYEQAPMPNAIFFAPGYAIHGFTKSAWGHPVSHGCVRLPVDKAAILFEMVKAEGADVNIVGYSPAVAPTVASVRARARDDAARYDSGASAPYGAQGYGAAPDGRSPQGVPGRSDGLFGSIY